MLCTYRWITTLLIITNCTNCLDSTIQFIISGSTVGHADRVNNTMQHHWLLKNSFGIALVILSGSSSFYKIPHFSTVTDNSVYAKF